MSTYSKITRHPRTWQYESATWIDDYFGQHLYGVRFMSDDKVYPAGQVSQAELKHYWAADVFETFRRITDGSEESILMCLGQLQTVYNERWEADPIGGGGATLAEEE